MRLPTKDKEPISPPEEKGGSEPPRGTDHADSALQPARTRPHLRALRARLAGYLPILSVVAFLIFWQIVGSTVNPILFATPSAVVGAFVEQVGPEGLLIAAFIRAMQVLTIGFLLAAVVGIATGVLMGRSRTFYRILMPYVSFFQATPLIALTPLFVIWFGIGFFAEVAITFMLGVWVIIVNTSEGIRNTPRLLLDMAKVYHVPERAVVREVAIPHAIPYILAGLQVGLAKALIGVIIAEMTVSLAGLGGLVQRFGNSFNTAALLAAIITSSLVGVIGSSLLEVARRRLEPWNR